MARCADDERKADDGARNFFPSKNNKTSAWGTVLDGVMGGLSTGEIEVRNGVMRFTGETSLRNNGGFSMARTLAGAGAFSGSDAIRMRVKGDGRTYILGARKGRDSGESYWARFDTIDGEWVTVTIPISDMECHFFGQKRPGRITADEIRALEIYIYDKKAGPFEIEIESIDAINEMI